MEAYTNSVITNEDRTSVLEEIAKSYLAELQRALRDAKIARMSGAYGPNETPSSIEVKERQIQARVDFLLRKLKSIDAI